MKSDFIPAHEKSGALAPPLLVDCFGGYWYHVGDLLHSKLCCLTTHLNEDTTLKRSLSGHGRA